jgi:UDP:flavonoid glycosyltransferase YjiC (YdhE family)
MVTLAWGCAAAGHEVRIAAQPAISDVVERSGLPGFPVGGAYDVAAGIATLNKSSGSSGGRLPNTPDKIRELPPEVLEKILELRYAPHISAAADMADDLITFVADWSADLIVTDPWVLAAPLAAEKAGVPLVRHLFGPNPARILGFPGMGLPVIRWPTPLRKLYDQFGVTLRPDYAVRTVDACPASLQIPGEQNRIPVRYVPYNGSAGVPPWLARQAARSRVCVAWSLTNSAVAGPEGFRLPDIVSALADFDVEPVVLLRAADQQKLGDVPAGVQIAPELPARLVLPSCDAIIHHGGPGTMLTAAYYGVPQVIVAPTPEQVFHSGQLASVGAGIALRADDAGRDDIKTAIAAVMSDEGISVAARRLRDEILQQPSPADVVHELEELI